LRGDYGVYTFSETSTRRDYSDKTIDGIVKIALECEELTVSACNFLAFYRGEGKEKKIVDPLIHALTRNPDPKIRANAAYTLCYLFSRKIRKALVQALNDDNAEVRTRAAHSLAIEGIKTTKEENEAARGLLKLFNDESLTVRMNAIYAYGHIRRNPIDIEIHQLISLLKDESAVIRHVTAEALGCLKATNALNALKQMVEDEKYVSPWASGIWAILQIEPSYSKVIKERLWEYPYIIQLRSADVNERKTAAETLRRIGTEISLPFLRELHDDYENDLRRGISGELFYGIRDIEERIKRNNP
jgi:HEAT repeat protein